MDRKSNNYHRRGGSGFLRNYNRGANHNGAQGDRSSGNWSNFNRPYNSGNHGNYGDSKLLSSDDQDNGFQKFRDYHARKQGNKNMRSHFSQERGGRRTERRGRKYFANETEKITKKRFEDRNGVEHIQNKNNVQNFTVANSSSSIKIVPEAVPSTIDTRDNFSVPNKTIQDSFFVFLENIKQENIEKKEDKRSLKTPPTSPSSSESAENENELPEQNKSEKDINNVKAPVEQNQKIIIHNSSSSSSSSSEEDEEDNNKSLTVPVKKISDSSKKQMSKNGSEKDIICLGKVGKEFAIEEDISEAEVSEKNKVITSKDQCLICDNQGHTAFECQMICKNCSAPYHNMKSCSKPAKLSTMLLSFMDFCTKQVGQFNPEQKFVLPTCAQPNKKAIRKPNTGSKKISKKSRNKSREPVKKRHNENSGIPPIPVKSKMMKTEKIMRPKKIHLERKPRVIQTKK